MEVDEDAIRYRWETVGRHLDERGRRLFAAAEVRTAGWGGLAGALTAMGHPISADTVAKELAKLGFSRQHNRKADEGSRHPDRDA